MGRSRGGRTSNTHTLVDTNGLPVLLPLTPGKANDNRACWIRAQPSFFVGASRNLISSSHCEWLRQEMLSFLYFSASRAA
jgi:hypothetical protein